MTTDAVDEIMIATHRALRKRGYAELTMQDIADESELSKSALHYHFDGKHDLLVSFLEHLLDRFEERIADPDGENPAERLHSLVDTMVAPPEPRSDGFQTALLEIQAQAPHDEDYRERLERFDEAFVSRLRSLLAAGVEDGTFRDDADPDEAASLLATYLKGVQMRHVAAGHSLERSATVIHRHIDDRLVAGETTVVTPE
ncbi:TetR/AcrR family transcriptional regulator [Halopelagius longus]|uniref:TetR/AcrR family transcriptional regulator n=1 Tax=Halopelagius longus TaxID=1236180 RepID=A0A1H1GHR5_9EURY|nr:TetR/AcrR family transcriptional regulator [Halopelagius longus]RDI69734.1 TetR/AcrR family transcriptional regulator [Halopelagius longus]SDR12760.1 transcriptional regulator, TetR family [Halopelagius longus]